ncbi:16115_t:CDS:1, partial [Funneliformis geosporum]
PFNQPSDKSSEQFLIKNNLERHIRNDHTGKQPLIILGPNELELKEVLITSESNYDDAISEGYSSNCNYSVDVYHDQNDFDHPSKQTTFIPLYKDVFNKNNLKRHIRHHHANEEYFICFEQKCHGMRLSSHDLLASHQKDVHESLIYYV